jgi:hypothetical protein
MSGERRRREDEGGDNERVADRLIAVIGLGAVMLSVLWWVKADARTREKDL